MHIPEVALSTGYLITQADKDNALLKQSENDPNVNYDANLRFSRCFCIHSPLRITLYFTGRKNNPSTQAFDGQKLPVARSSNGQLGNHRRAVYWSVDMRKH